MKASLSEPGLQDRTVTQAKLQNPKQQFSLIASPMWRERILHSYSIHNTLKKRQRLSLQHGAVLGEGNYTRVDFVSLFYVCCLRWLWGQVTQDSVRLSLNKRQWEQPFPQRQRTWLLLLRKSPYTIPVTQWLSVLLAKLQQAGTVLHWTETERKVTRTG